MHLLNLTSFQTPSRRKPGFDHTCVQQQEALHLFLLYWDFWNIQPLILWDFSANLLSTVHPILQRENRFHFGAAIYMHSVRARQPMYQQKRNHDIVQVFNILQPQGAVCHDILVIYFNSRSMSFYSLGNDTICNVSIEPPRIGVFVVFHLSTCPWVITFPTFQLSSGSSLSTISSWTVCSCSKIWGQFSSCFCKVSTGFLS